MPWKECHVVDERLRFVARLLDGEKMAALCAEFGISRKTGYKIYDRYKDCGVDGLTDRSRRPYRHANQLPMAVEKLIVAAEAGVSRLGRAEDSRAAAPTRWPGVRCPAISTVHAVLDRHGLVTRARPAPAPGPRDGAHVAGPAECPLVCGLQGRVHAGRPALLLPAHHHRLRQPLPASAARRSRRRKERYAFTVFERVFKDFGLPAAIRTDNGVPFASPNALYGLSRLSVWWLRLGIQIERIKPGPPRAERAARADASHAETRSHQARRAQLPPAAGPLRYVPGRATTTSGRTRPWGCASRASSTRVARARTAGSPTWPTRSTTGRPSSPTAAGSASTGGRSISARSLPGSRSACGR